jgi:hypothetical protein
MVTHEFVPSTGGESCPNCGSLLGRFGSDEQLVCPSPVCNDGVFPEGVEPSVLYRAFALIFMPDEPSKLEDVPESQRKREVGVIRAVQPDLVQDPVVRRNSPIVATEVVWPDDRDRFNDLFDHHIHHENAPQVTPLNDGWDAGRHVPVL